MTLLFLAIIVLSGTGGEIATSHAMKQIGEVHGFSPAMLVDVFKRAIRIGWMWVGIALMATAFFTLLALLSWADVSFVAEEVREPGRTLPRALIGGSVLIIGLYLLINAGYFYSLEPRTVTNLPEASSVANVVMVRMLGAGGAPRY